MSAPLVADDMPDASFIPAAGLWAPPSPWHAGHAGHADHAGRPTASPHYAANAPPLYAANAPPHYAANVTPLYAPHYAPHPPHYPPLQNDTWAWRPSGAAAASPWANGATGDGGVAGVVDGMGGLGLGGGAVPAFEAQVVGEMSGTRARQRQAVRRAQNQSQGQGQAQRQGQAQTQGQTQGQRRRFGGEGHAPRARGAQRRRRRPAGDGGSAVAGGQGHRNGHGNGQRQGHQGQGQGHGTLGRVPFSVQTSVREYNRRISACARRRDLSGSLAALAELDASATAVRNLFTYNAIINAMVMCNQYARAEARWNEMLDEGIEPTLVSYNTRLKSCFGGSGEDVARAFRLVEEMDGRGIAADRVTFNSLINSCVAAGRVVEAREVYEKMQKMRIAPDDFTFTTLSKSGQNVEMLDALLVHQLNHHTALQMQRAAEQKASLHTAAYSDRRFGSSGGGYNGKAVGGRGTGDDHGPICPVAYNAIADAYIRCGHPLRALDLLNRMRDPVSLGLGKPVPKDCIPVAPDVQTFNVKLKALRESGASAKDAFATLEEMQALGLETDHISLLTLADLFCRRCEMGLAEGVLSVATSADVREVDSGSDEWSSLFLSGIGHGGGGHGQSGRGKAAGGGGGGAHRRSNNQPRNAKANASLFNALIRGYSSLDPPNVEAAVALYSEMRRFVNMYGFHFYAPDSVTYTMLVDAFARVGDADGAERIISDMEAAGPGSTSVVAYNALLKANRGNGSTKAFAIFDRIKSRGLRPDIVTVNTLIDQLISTGEPNGMQLAERLVEQMPQWGLTPELQTYNTLLKGAARSKSFSNNPSAALNSAYRWLRELRKNKLQEDQWTWQSMVAAAAAAGDAPRALEFFRCVEAERARRHHAPDRSSVGSAGGSGVPADFSGVKMSESWYRNTSIRSEHSAMEHGRADAFDNASPPPTSFSSVQPPMVGGNIISPRAGSPGSLASAGASVGENLIMLGSKVVQTGSSVSASASYSRQSSGGDITGSLSSAGGSNEEWMLLAHPSAYISLMRAFLSSGRYDGIDATLRLRDEMVERKMPLGRAGYTVVADAYALRGDFEKVEDTLREMTARDPVASGPALSPIHHSIRIKCLCNAGRVDEAVALLPECKDADAAVYNTVLFSVVKSRDMNKMITVLREMETAGVEPDDITAKALQPLMFRLSKVLRTFDSRFHSRLAEFAARSLDGSDGSPESFDSEGINDGPAQCD